MPSSNWAVDTRAVHAGDPRPRVAGAVVPPIFQSANFEFTGDSDYHDLRYIRLNNTPGQAAAAARLASLEGAEDALVAGSGMAAISTALLGVAGAGDHVLFSRLLYGGTRALVATELPRLGIRVGLIDPEAPETWEAALRPETKAIYVETISNPTLRIPDLEAVVEFGRQHGLVTMVDNTFASPVNFRPPEIGFDLSLHSATKYLNGHSDIVAGTVIGRHELVERVRQRLNVLGGTLDPHACFLLARGMMTLALRVRRQNASALELARALSGHPAVAAVNYPGLPDHPGHERARRLFDGFGGMLSFELRGGAGPADRFIEALEIPIAAPSLGVAQSLVTRPAATSHAPLTAEERASQGISDGLVRMSVGIEAVEDLQADMLAALTAAVS